jgi:hypothetical protein
MTIASSGTKDTILRSLGSLPRRDQLWAVLVFLIIVVLLFMFSVSTMYDNAKNSIIMEKQKVYHPRNVHEYQKREGHSMCILIPFRDCWEELTEFVLKITDFLKRQNVKHKIVVINQVCEYNFLLYYLTKKYFIK